VRVGWGSERGRGRREAPKPGHPTHL